VGCPCHLRALVTRVVRTTVSVILTATPAAGGARREPFAANNVLATAARWRAALRGGARVATRAIVRQSSRSSSVAN